MQYHGLGDPLGGTLSLGSAAGGIEPGVMQSRVGGNAGSATTHALARNSALRGTGHHNRPFTLSQVSALTCGQVSEVSSQGEASRPNFAPKIDSSRLPIMGGGQAPGQDPAKHKPAMRVTGHSLGVIAPGP